MLGTLSDSTRYLVLSRDESHGSADGREVSTTIIDGEIQDHHSSFAMPLAFALINLSGYCGPALQLSALGDYWLRQC